MSSTHKIEDSLREAILSRPDVILDDKDVMHALVAANERAMGNNVIDMRGLAMARLEDRLGRLEDTHRSVIAAAYENLAGTNQIHRAVLHLLDAPDFAAFLATLRTDVAETLRVDVVRLLLETQQPSDDPALAKLSDVLSFAAPGFVSDYLTLGRGGYQRNVTLRQLTEPEPSLYGDNALWVQSEACLKLDFGPGRLPGLLLLGAEDPHVFGPQQGTDLLAFFGGVFERSMRRWLG